MSYEYQYELCVLEKKILLETTFAIEIQKETKEFMHPFSKGASPISEENTTYFDWKISVSPCDILPNISEKMCYTELSYFERTEENLTVFRCNTLNGAPFAWVQWSPSKKHTEIHFLNKRMDLLRYSRSLTDVIGFEILFLYFDAFILHASFIETERKGILFSAPSGTGKSTQAELWNRYEHAEILNGDRAGIIRQDGKWVGYGLPYAGSSGIYKNRGSEIHALVLLVQGNENIVRPVSLSQALRKVYPETFIHHWDSTFVNKITGILLQFLSEVPIYELSCLPDQGAVEVLKRHITFWENEIHGND